MPYDLLLREGRINTMTVRNRLIAGPMERNLANRDGSLTQTHIDYMAERARGGAGMVTVDSTYVDARGMGHLYQVGCHGDHVIPGLRRLAEAVHAEGSKVAIVLNLGGRQTPSSMSQLQPVAPSVVICEILAPPPTPRELTVADIKEVIGKFADAAGRAVVAGLDMIGLQGAHGFLLDAFCRHIATRERTSTGALWRSEPGFISSCWPR